MRREGDVPYTYVEMDIAFPKPLKLPANLLIFFATGTTLAAVLSLLPAEQFVFLNTLGIPAVGRAHGGTKLWDFSKLIPKLRPLL